MPKTLARSAGRTKHQMTHISAVRFAYLSINAVRRGLTSIPISLVAQQLHTSAFVAILQ